MPKLGMEEFRKKQVIYSTLDLIGEVGMGKLTLDKVASKAGVSKGVVTYYFRNKEEMIYESYSYMLKAFTSDEYYEYLEQLSREEILHSISSSVLGDISLFEELEGVKLNLNPDSYKYLLIQMFSKAATSDVFKEMVKNHYSHYFEAICMIFNDGDTRLSKIKSIQFMALLDGLLLYKVINFSSGGINYDEVVKDFVFSAIKG